MGAQACASIGGRTPPGGFQVMPGSEAGASSTYDTRRDLPRESFEKLRAHVRNEIRCEEERAGYRIVMRRETLSLEQHAWLKDQHPLDNRLQVLDDLPDQPSFSSVQTKSASLNAYKVSHAVRCAQS
jgi:hypothetical protein